MSIEFYKITAAGNDFILFLNFSNLKKLPYISRAICDRHYGVGADGVLNLLSRKGEFEVLYLNSDGSYAFCGNGTRASAFFIHKVLRINHNFVIKTSAGVLSCHIRKDGVFVEMPPTYLLKKLSFSEFPSFKEGYYLLAGTHHLVFITDDVDSIDVVKLGKFFRFHTLFKPDGVNVNFVEILKKRKNLITAKIRTYEKGVEGETLSCASGITSVFHILREIYDIEESVFLTRGGDQILLKKDQDRVFALGPVRIICKGEFFEV